MVIVVTFFAYKIFSAGNIYAKPTYKLSTNHDTLKHIGLHQGPIHCNRTTLVGGDFSQTPDIALSVD